MQAAASHTQRMETKRRREWPVVLAIVAALALAIPGLYVAGYFWLPEVEQGFWVPDNTPVVHRTFQAQWLARIYEPAGRLEKRLMNYDVEIGSTSDAWGP
jgi:hypothetical protein